ncbi:MAG: hypothetical protein JST00_30535 [Deltaproteobacteria bacterium]|nr:hypothetical protein [Deltaproteobacteria bacterium]
MAKFQSPLLGYNNNVRHKNRVFHIQTEDSGVNHPHIITHLFMDGGRILKSVKRSYAEHVGAEGMSEIVRGLMKEQHKAMFIALRDGQFDALVEPPAPGSEPKVAEAKADPKPEAKADAKAEPKPESKPASTEPTEAKPVSTEPTEAKPVAKSIPPVPKGSDPEIAPVTIDESKRPPRHSAPPPPASREAAAAASAKVDMPKSEPAPTTLRDRPVPSAKDLTLDFDALEQAAQDAVVTTAPSLFHTNDLPPPPKNLFAKERGTGAYRTVDGDEPAPSSRAKPSVPPAAAKETSKSSPSAARARGGSGRPGDARYAPARPAAIFGTTQRPPHPSAPPGDELLSDKSLDEVILSYLAEDLEPPRRK